MYGVGRVYLELEEIINKVVEEHQKKIDAEENTNNSNSLSQATDLPAVSEDVNE